jgi:hypothetical protein
LAEEIHQHLDESYGLAYCHPKKLDFMLFFEHSGGAAAVGDLLPGPDKVSPAFDGSTVRLKLGFARAS